MAIVINASRAAGRSLGADEPCAPATRRGHKRQRRQLENIDISPIFNRNLSCALQGLAARIFNKINLAGELERGSIFCNRWRTGIGAASVTVSLLAASGAAHAASEKVVYSFQGGTDGASPEAALLDVGGKLYGTTNVGGAKSIGTVFALTTAGAEKVLYSFQGFSDGSHPTAPLISVGGKLYGTTSLDGVSQGGTVFSITKSGAEKVVYAFSQCADIGSASGLLNVGGLLYGTTRYCGANKLGTVFSVTTGGVGTVLHTFSYNADGVYPAAAGLINVGGTLYGTTSSGGLGQNAAGTVFSITPDGAETILHSFGVDSSDGAIVLAGLVNVGGTFYGTTWRGGANDLGTVFSVTPAGVEQVLHSFGGGSDGAYPEAGLVNVGGTLYGTTHGGGAHKRGTVFAITTTGTEEVVYSFKSTGGDGTYPLAGLIDVHGILYGTTQ